MKLKAFGMGWMVSFDLLNLPMNMFCYSVKEASASAENLKGNLNQIFPNFFFSEGLGICIKAKDNAQPNYNPQWQVPFVAREIIEK